MSPLWVFCYWKYFLPTFNKSLIARFEEDSNGIVKRTTSHNCTFSITISVNTHYVLLLVPLVNTKTTNNSQSDRKVWGGLPDGHHPQLWHLADVRPWCRRRSLRGRPRNPDSHGWSGEKGQVQRVVDRNKRKVSLLLHNYSLKTAHQNTERLKLFITLFISTEPTLNT